MSGRVAERREVSPAFPIITPTEYQGFDLITCMELCDDRMTWLTSYELVSKSNLVFVGEVIQIKETRLRL